MAMPRRFERIGSAFEAIGRAVEPKDHHSDTAMNLLHRSCNTIMICAVIFGIIAPIIRFQLVLLVVIALGLGTMGMAVFAKGARTAPSMLLWTFVAILLLGLTMTLLVLLAR
jgi:hypothetical protein